MLKLYYILPNLLIMSVSACMYCPIDEFKQYHGTGVGPSWTDFRVRICAGLHVAHLLTKNKGHTSPTVCKWSKKNAEHLQMGIG